MDKVHRGWVVEEGWVFINRKLWCERWVPDGVWGEVCVVCVRWLEKYF